MEGTKPAPGKFSIASSRLYDNIRPRSFDLAAAPPGRGSRPTRGARDPRRPRLGRPRRIPGRALRRPPRGSSRRSLGVVLAHRLPRPPSSPAEFILLFHALALAYPPLSPAAYFLNAGDPPVAAFAPVVLRRCSARLSLPRAARLGDSSVFASSSVGLIPMPARRACGGLPPTSDSLMTSRNGEGSAYTVLPNRWRLKARHRKSLRLARVSPT